MPNRRFAQVDVFTDVALRGNPVAVVLDGVGLSAATMQAFCDWTNLSEATFVVPATDPGADYAVRIFCPGRELPFAGHPTLGTCHAWLQAGGQPRHPGRVIQQCGVGLVEIRREPDGALSFAAPPLLRGGPLSPVEVDRIVAVLGIDPATVVGHQWCDNGPGWQALLLDSADAVLAVQPVDPRQPGFDVGIAGRHPRGGDVALEVRAFFSGSDGNLIEDPVTGSLNAALGQWLISDGVMPQRYLARQGTAVGRDGRVIVERDGDVTWVGGQSITVLEGYARL